MKKLIIIIGILSAAGGAGRVVAQEFAFIITSDFITGSASTVSLPAPYTVTQNVASVHGDAVARFFDGLFYVVNRGGADNIQMLDPGAGFSTVREFTVGTGSNPHDIALASARKAYVLLHIRR